MAPWRQKEMELASTGDPFDPEQSSTTSIHPLSAKGAAIPFVSPIQKALSMLTQEEIQSWFVSFRTDIVGSSTQQGIRRFRLKSLNASFACFPLPATSCLTRWSVRDRRSQRRWTGRNSIGVDRSGLSRWRSGDLQIAVLPNGCSDQSRQNTQSTKIGNPLYRTSLWLTKFARTGAVTYRLLDEFRSLFDGQRYLHRRSTSGDLSPSICSKISTALPNARAKGAGLMSAVG